MTRLALIPPGVWPPRMTAELAAGYCGERTVEAFNRRVGKDYPKPIVKTGRRRIWLKEDLDRAISGRAPEDAADVAADL
jgi:hypothetical protein